MSISSLLISAMGHRRIVRALAWLEARAPAEEVLIIGASLNAANELVRRAPLNSVAFLALAVLPGLQRSGIHKC